MCGKHQTFCATRWWASGNGCVRRVQSKPETEAWVGVSHSSGNWAYLSECCEDLFVPVFWNEAKTGEDFHGENLKEDLSRACSAYGSKPSPHSSQFVFAVLQPWANFYPTKLSNLSHVGPCSCFSCVSGLAVLCFSLPFIRSQSKKRGNSTRLSPCTCSRVGLSLLRSAAASPRPAGPQHDLSVNRRRLWADAMASRRCPPRQYSSAFCFFLWRTNWQKSAI